MDGARLRGTLVGFRGGRDGTPHRDGRDPGASPRHPAPSSRPSPAARRRSKIRSTWS